MINSLAAMNLPTGGPTVEFYQQWSDYLSPQPHIFLTLVMLFMHSIALIFFYLGDGVLQAYNHSFDLFGFLNIFFSPNNSTYQTWNLGNIIRLMVYVGFVAFGIMMLVQWIQFIATSGRKGSEWPKGISITMGILLIIPLIISLFTTIGKSASQDVMGNANSNVLTRLWQGNSTDLSKLAKKNFDINSYNQYMNQSENQINTTRITGSDYHSVMSDAGYTDGLDKAQKSVFTKKIGGNNQLVDTTGGTLVLGKTFADEYPVIKTNWLGIIAGEIVFIFVVCAAIVRIFTSIYKMAFMSGSIIYFGLRDGTQGKRVQQILSLIEGQITGIVMMPISLVFFFAWIDFAFKLINNMNLSVWPFMVLSIAALIAGAKGLFSGFELIEQWTGVRSGHNPVASMMLAGQASRMIGGAAKAAKQNIGKGLNALSPAQQKKNREAGKNLVNKNPLDMSNANTKDHTLDENGPDNQGKAARLAGGLGRAAGAMKSPGALMKNTGRAGLNRAKEGVKDAVDNVKDYGNGIKDGFEGGKQAVDAFNKRHSPVDPNQSMSDKDTGGPQPKNVHDALANAQKGVTRGPESTGVGSGTVSASSGSGNTTTTNMSQKLQGARQGLNQSSHPNYIDGGFIPPLAQPTNTSRSSGSDTPSSAMTPANSYSSTSGIKEVPLPSRNTASGEVTPPRKPVSQMSEQELKAHDKAFAKEAIRKSLEQRRQDKK
ncbi:pLS20_p028 family conjugation system transmembrane protein [Leuconostoc pseudomesenteroides]|uniref:pLS20_p028 family conjugation system transmembrane protein n=1 Tax=Leuconostoc pseudomesenteroides TaxID=33968 RepID=UPI0032DEF6B8